MKNFRSNPCSLITHGKAEDKIFAEAFEEGPGAGVKNQVYGLLICVLVHKVATRDEKIKMNE